MSPDLGDMWKYGCPKSPDWDSDLDVWTEGEEFSEDNEEISKVNTKGLQKVWDGPCWDVSFSGSLGCRRNAHDGQQLGTFQVNTGFLLPIQKEPTFYGEVVDFGRDGPSVTEDGESFSGEEGEHNVDNFMGFSKNLC